MGLGVVKGTALLLEGVTASSCPHAYVYTYTHTPWLGSSREPSTSHSVAKSTKLKRSGTFQGVMVYTIDFQRRINVFGDRSRTHFAYVVLCAISP